MCSCEYCADLIHLADVCGIDISQDGHKELVHRNPEWRGRKARHALGVLSTQHAHQLFAGADIFARLGNELPEGASEAYRFYAERRKNWDPVAEKPDPEMRILVPPLQASPFRVTAAPGVVVDVLTIETKEIKGGG